jgi:benzoyl-CoA reductase/2-hydroxyglutaryl-CoA dehydratase subunit BcrC/BadD/HgdB
VHGLHEMRGSLPNRRDPDIQMVQVACVLFIFFRGRKKTHREATEMNASIANVPDIKQQAIRKKIRQEYSAELSALKQRDDYLPEYDYFLNILSLHADPDKFRRMHSKTVAALNCLQAPPEIFHALGFLPYRFCSNTLSKQDFAASKLPALACPVIKSCLSAFSLDDSVECLADLIVIAGTCDWMTRLPEMIDRRAKAVHFMELPHMKESERGCRRWVEEIILLKSILEKISGRKMSRQNLRRSIEQYALARLALRGLLDARSRNGISALWCMIITNAFLMGDVEGWSDSVSQVLAVLRALPTSHGSGIFLAGSPVMFPNLKVVRLIENAGMHIVADELCTSERILLGAPVFEDNSEFAMLRALSEQSHMGCSCPTYAVNDRRLTNIMETMASRNISGLVLHILKGCHPYDIGSFKMEQTLREKGFHFLRVETDHSPEDSKSLLLRLEAFSEVIKEDR